MRSRFALILLLISLFMASPLPAEEKCLVNGTTDRISGKVEFRHIPANLTLPRDRTGYIVKLLKPRCHVEENGDRWDQPVTEVHVFKGSPANLPAYWSPEDKKVEAERTRIEAFLGKSVGRYVIVEGLVMGAFGPLDMTNPTMEVLSIDLCEVSPNPHPGVKSC